MQLDLFSTPARQRQLEVAIDELAERFAQPALEQMKLDADCCAVKMLKQAPLLRMKPRSSARRAAVSKYFSYRITCATSSSIAAVRAMGERVSLIDVEATKRKLDQMMG